MHAAKALVLGLSLLGFAPVQQATADLSVGMTAWPTPLIPGARYDVSITNHGPDPVTSATVVVTLDPRLTAGAVAPCALDTAADTMTCVFGPLSSGATATTSAFVYYSFGGPRSISATASRTVSSPPDPHGANDTVTVTCWYVGSPGLPPSPVPPLTC